MRKDIVYLGMIRCSDIMSLNTSDEGYNDGKKYGQKGAICGPNNKWLTRGQIQQKFPHLMGELNAMDTIAS
jgi:hypothetical protein